MTTLISRLYSEMTDEELQRAIQEIGEDSVQGIYRMDGMVREMARRSSQITHQPLSEMLFMVEIGIYKEAAFRYTPKSTDTIAAKEEKEEQK